MVDLFWDPEAEGFFDTGRDHEALVVRPRSLFDSAVPCGSSVAADVLLRLAVLTGDADLEQRGVATIRSVAPLMARYPSGFGRFLAALDFHLGSPVEVAVVWAGDGPPAEREPLLAPLLAEVFRRYLPNRVLTGGVEGSGRGPAAPCRQAGPGRPADGLRLREVRVPGAHDRAGRAGRPARPARWPRQPRRPAS